MLVSVEKGCGSVVFTWPRRTNGTFYAVSKVFNYSVKMVDGLCSRHGGWKIHHVDYTVHPPF